MDIIIFFVYLAFFIFNVIYSVNKRYNYLFILFSFIFISFMLCGHFYVGNGDSTDLYYYERIYNYPEYYGGSNLYYLFNLSQHISHFFHMTYRVWWVIMSFFVVYLYIRTAERNNVNIHFSLYIFMVFAIDMYTGLKYFYGFFFFLIGLMFLLKEGRYNKIYFILFTMLAGGFHAMYYFFFVLVLFDHQKITAEFIFKSVFLFILLMLVVGPIHIIDFIQDVISNILGDNLPVYFIKHTKFSWIIPISIHLVLLGYLYKYYVYAQRQNLKSIETEAIKLIKINLLMACVYPLFFMSLTFMRFYVVMVFSSLFYSGRGCSYFSKEYKNKIIFLSFIVILFYSSYGLVTNTINYNLIPFFDNYYIGLKWC